MRFWLYKCNADEGGPSGYSGDWTSDMFSHNAAIEWGGHYSSRSPEVWRYLDEDVSAGDVVVAYQTDLKAIVGFCRVVRLRGPVGDRQLILKPIARLDPPFEIHRNKAGTPLATSNAVNGPVMLRELTQIEMATLIAMTGTPRDVLSANA